MRSSTTTQRELNLDGMELLFENSSREHSLGHCFLRLISLGKHQQPQPISQSQVVGFIASSPFLNVMSSCGKKSPVFLAVWNGSSFQCINSTPWNSSNGFLAYKNHIHSSGPVVGRGCFLFWWWVVLIVHKQFVSQLMSLPLTAFFRRCYMDRVSVVLPLAMESQQVFKGSIYIFIQVHVW